MFKKIGDNFKFIETSVISKERKALGWGLETRPSYVVTAYEFNHFFASYQELIAAADVVIIGSAPYRLIKNRLNSKKLTFLYSERLYKSKYQYYKMPFRIIRDFFKYSRYHNLYLLCASAFAAADFAKSFTFLNKSYKWGYFPETVGYENFEHLMNAKQSNSILWVARFIDLKHPEIPIEIAKRLKNDGYIFTLNLIGNGILEEKVKQEIIDNGLSDCVHLLGSMKPEQVRAHMEESKIFLFTSDRHEGWGAVLNESMNSGCAVVASHAIGSVPFLIRNGENGLIYKDGDIEDIYKKVQFLLDNNDICYSIGSRAYLTITNEWNSENAADRFLLLAQNILDGNRSPELFETEVCSKAEILKDSWFTNEHN